MTPNEPRRHHYIPIFYTKQWADDNGRICEFSSQNGQIKSRMTYPKGTGYRLDLYTIPGLPLEKRTAMESHFFGKTDQLASDALKLMLCSDISTLDLEKRSAWTRFVLSLLYRNPEQVISTQNKWKKAVEIRIAEIEANYDSFRLPNDPPTFAEFKTKMNSTAVENAGALFLQNIIDSKNVGAFINGMRWSIVTFDNLPYPLLTSDRPIAMTRGLKYQDSHLIMPINPTQAFVAVNTIEEEQWLKNMPAKLFAQMINAKVVSQAEKYVYSTDSRQLRFVTNRLGKREPQFLGIE